MRVRDVQPTIGIGKHQGGIVSPHCLYRQADDELGKALWFLTLENRSARFVESGSAAQSSPLQGSEYRGQKVGGVEGLLNKVERPLTDALDRVFDLRIPGGNHHLGLRSRLLRDLQNFQPADPRHPNVANEKVEFSAPDLLQSLGAIRRGNTGATLGPAPP